MMRMSCVTGRNIEGAPLLPLQISSTFLQTPVSRQPTNTIDSARGLISLMILRWSNSARTLYMNSANKIHIHSSAVGLKLSLLAPNARVSRQTNCPPMSGGTRQYLTQHCAWVGRPTRSCPSNGGSITDPGNTPSSSHPQTRPRSLI